MSISPQSPEQAIAQIIAPFERGEGIRHLWLGDTRMGKTYANRELIKICVARRLVDVVLTVDEKDPRRAQYEGVYRATPADLRAVPLSSREQQTPGALHLVFRGIAHRRDLDEAVEPSEVATMAWDLVRLNACRVLINLDELADATNGYQAWTGESLAQIYRKGGGIGLSVDATTQLPQLLPREAFGLTETIGVFRMDGREVSYLRRVRALDDPILDRIPTLKVGEWLLYKKGGGGWDGKVYKFP